MEKFLIIIAIFFNGIVGWCQLPQANPESRDSVSHFLITSKKFIACTDFLDAAINSINSFNSLVKKENYRIKIVSFNNPTSNDLGFNLEHEINNALKPLLAKAKQVHPGKFSEVVASIIQTPEKLPAAKTMIFGMNPMFSSLLGMVGSLAIQEKRITRADIDSFIISTSKYFVQYQKLNLANYQFDQGVNRLDIKIIELQYDVKEFLIDLVSILYNDIQRSQVKYLNSEEIYLKYLEKNQLQKVLLPKRASATKFPSDGIKNSKDIAYTIQKIFNEYQKIYSENYQQIRNILVESKTFGKNINQKLVEASLKELEELYNDSRLSDNLGLRLNTLFERLKVLSATDQLQSLSAGE